MLSDYCDEFLVHAVDVEGKQCGIDEELISLLSNHCKAAIAYAGGIKSFEDMEKIGRLGHGKIDFTVGSALDIFGGHLEFEKIAEIYK